ncbi:GNAT family N-acetyltransferase [Blastopirellula sp. J2-11]|uniref:GNAT family N-acetyltransferase n=1 Tax=Blastopirellula sp. J2-11 TaxID=2943192 RepID=UPI00396743E7
MGTEVKPPSEWTKETRSEFKSLICEGGEVTTVGLTERIENALALVCHRAGDKLIGIAALKRPAESYRAKVSEQSGVTLSNDAFPFELGWVYVRPEGRKCGVSKQLVATCLEVTDSAGVFATTREDNDPMRCCLAKSGFKRVGHPYESEHGDHYLVVYVREEQKPDSIGTPVVSGT